MRERRRATPDEEAIERIRRDVGKSEQEARFVLAILRGDTAGDAFIRRGDGPQERTP